MKKGLLLFLCCFILTAGFLTGCKKDTSKVLRLLSWEGYAPMDQIAKFKEETGITVEVTLSNNEEMISKLKIGRAHV